MALLLVWANFSVAVAQRINFSTWTGSSDIVITQVAGQTGNMNFAGKNGGKRNFLVPGSAQVKIEMEDAQAAIFRIDAPSGFEITVELTAPSALTLPGSTPLESIPLILNMAYSNDAANHGTGFPNPKQAVLVPQGFNAVTFPITKRSASGPPLPPRIAFGDGNGGMSRDKSSAFVFIYGAFGPVPADASAGTYTANVVLSVYATAN
ncbi:hypothetical protein ACFPIK_15435 [Algoriphagus aquatilis]|uniref:Uncharacterized protein n=1 Tax=Algoriphagus aquatilis TaxID=490186 RepID=A0ABW0BYY1_9BACT